MKNNLIEEQAVKVIQPNIVRHSEKNFGSSMKDLEVNRSKVSNPSSVGRSPPLVLNDSMTTEPVENLGKFKRDLMEFFHDEVQGLHVDMIRQFEI